MPLLDVQQRFRELGRIRAGKKVATSGGKQRPTKLPRYRLTSPWAHLIEAAAEIYGGEARPWDNDGRPEFEVEVAVDCLPIVIPPGEVMEQWYELWTGGGCQRRCDGIRQVLVDKACQCPADPIERSDEAGRGRACKPTTRLRVMLPDLPDVGIWRLESHGYHAAAELGGAVGLIEAATRSGALIPADLRLAAREGSRRPGQPTKKFFVPVISFRGALAPTLDALGILEAGSSMPRHLADGVERRPALDSGGAPALPPGGTSFDPDRPPVEPAAIPETPVPDPAPPPPPPPEPEEAPEPEGFAPPPPMDEAPTPDLGEPDPMVPPDPAPADAHEPGDGGRSYTGPQLVAMKFQDRGITDRGHRLRMVSFLCHREISSGNDLKPAEVRLVLDLLNDDAGFAELVGEVPPETETAIETTATETPATAPEALVPDEVTPPSSHGRRRPIAAAPGPDPAMDASGWRIFLADRGVKAIEVIREAARLARAAGSTPPGNLEQIAESGLGADLIGFVEEKASARGDS